jgi:tetratricopeptide (TPR) repeat protein
MTFDPDNNGAKSVALAQGAEPETDFREAMELLKNEYPDKALVKLQRAFASDKHNPYYMSFLGLSLARAEQKWDEASDLCAAAIQLKRNEIRFHLNLIEVYVLAGLRDDALHRVERALKLFHNDARLKRLRGKVLNRRAPLLPFLKRTHFLNRKLGQLRHRLLEKLEKS